MSAPTPSSRTVPTGLKTKEGFQVYLTLSSIPGINLWEKELTPPGIDNGAPIDITTQFNNVVKQYSPRFLKDIKPIKGTYAYDPSVWDDLMDQIGKEQTITYHWPNGDSLALFGYMKAADFKTQKEGDFSMMDCEFQPTNRDPSSDDDTEQIPVFTPGSGT